MLCCSINTSRCKDFMLVICFQHRYIELSVLFKLFHDTSCGHEQNSNVVSAATQQWKTWMVVRSVIRTLRLSLIIFNNPLAYSWHPYEKSIIVLTHFKVCTLHQIILLQIWNIFWNIHVFLYTSVHLKCVTMLCGVVRVLWSLVF